MNQKFWWDLLSDDEKKPLGCEIDVFWGEKDDRTTMEEMQAWEPLSSQEFNFFHYAGNHFFIHDDQQVAEFLDDVSDIIRKYVA